MMWYLQLLVEQLIVGLENDTLVNAVFAALVLWAGFGGPLRVCAVVTALMHLALAVI